LPLLALAGKAQTRGSRLVRGEGGAGAAHTHARAHPRTHAATHAPFDFPHIYCLASIETAENRF
jgi:hypothetical protein